MIIAGISGTIIYNDLIEIQVQHDYTKYKVKIGNRWLIGGIEKNRLLDGESVMQRFLNKIYVDTIYDEEKLTTTIIRWTPYKRLGAGITDIYFFDGKTKDIENVPIYHKVIVHGAVGMIYEYEVNSLTYDGPNLDLTGTEMSFGRQIKVTWDPGYLSAKVYSNGKLKIRYYVDSPYKEINVRLFDPIINDINITRIKEYSVEYYNVTVPIYEDIEYNYQCLGDDFKFTQNPKYAWCYKNETNGTQSIIFEHSFLKGDIPTQTVWWNVTEQTGTKIVELNRTIVTKLNRALVQIDTNAGIKSWMCDWDAWGECKLFKDEKLIKCVNKNDGDINSVCVHGGQSCITFDLSDPTSLKQSYHGIYKGLDKPENYPKCVRV